jgi:hypothetical protein
MESFSIGLFLVSGRIRSGRGRISGQVVSRHFQVSGCIRSGRVSGHVVSGHFGFQVG